MTIPNPPATSEERRAPVQASPYELIPRGQPGEGYSVFGEHRGASRDGKPGAVPGTIAWSEHLEAWVAYDRENPGCNTAERMAERHGFDWNELVLYLGHEPRTWRPR